MASGQRREEGTDGRDMHLTADLRHFWICHLNAELDFNEMTKLNSEISMQLIREMMFSKPGID